MKGTVVLTWIKTCRKLFSDEIVNQSLESVGFQRNVIFSPLVDVEEERVNSLFKEIGRNANQELDVLWHKIGVDNVTVFTEGYPAFFKHKNAFHFLSSMNDVHQIVIKRFAGAKPPILDMVPIKGNVATFTYRSKRAKFQYFLGLMEGVGKHFDEDIKIVELSRTHDTLELELTFEYPTETIKNYRLNRVMSLGLFKSTSFKISLLSALPLLITLLPISLFAQQIDTLTTLVVIGVGAIATFVGSKLIHRPLSYVIESLNDLIQHEYSSNMTVKSGDVYEPIFDKLNEYRGSMSKNFVSFNNMSDEMSTFSEGLGEISESMSVTSDDISGVVEQLAEAATSQAYEIESSIGVLSGNIDAVKVVAKEQNSNKDQLELSVEKIEVSFNGVEKTAGEISSMLKKFEVVKENGEELKKNASNIKDIVSLVSSISEQTNLLALNASIEAARAGEAGRGFTVVAQEVRKLSEETSRAVDKINESLSLFVNKIGSLVGDVNQQYNVLEQENRELANAVQNSVDAKMTIREVASIMVQTSRKLMSETEKIAEVFTNIQSLAAIAEENSASAEQVSSSVSVYTEQIKNLTQNVSDFKILTREFGDELGVYKF
ncbi:MAG: heme NO-binding domain-containing protein [Alkaliphilus sp.]